MARSRPKASRQSLPPKRSSGRSPGRPSVTGTRESKRPPAYLQRSFGTVNTETGEILSGTRVGHRFSRRSSPNYLQRSYGTVNLETGEILMYRPIRPTPVRTWRESSRVLPAIPPANRHPRKAVQASVPVSMRSGDFARSLICFKRKLKRIMVFATGNGGRNNFRRYLRSPNSNYGC